jgi:hypothetical protein
MNVKHVAMVIGLLCGLMTSAAWAQSGSMIVSDRDQGLAINAWGGAQHGTELKLHNACRPDNPDCTWRYR